MMKVNRALSMYACMVSKLNHKKVYELKRHQGFKDIDVQVGPLLLWKTIKELLYIAVTC
jgi:hypothetical protein